MAVELTGTSLTLGEVVAVARHAVQVEIAGAALTRMRERRVIVERAGADGAPVYGVTTGVGMRRGAVVDDDNARSFNRSAILGHLVGLGPRAAEDVARASLLRLANGIVAGYQGARPEIAQALVAALNANETPSMSTLGTVGQADLAQQADLAYGSLARVELEAGEALALLAGNAFSTGQAALVIADASVFLRWLDVAAALDYEAFRANVGALHPEIARARPYPGIRDTLERMHDLLADSPLWEPGAAKFLQDPLTFRCVPQVHGAARDALRFVEEQLAVELNAHQGNPLIVESEGRLVSVGNFDSQPLATALDLLRIALAPVLTAAVERVLKLLSPQFSGLGEGLVPGERSWQDGLSELGVAAQAIAAEARLLAQPVSYELVSTMQESGVEDRAALSSLAARRASELLDLGSRVVAIELTVAAQAVDLRRLESLGRGASAAHAFVRERVPLLEDPEQMPLPLEELAECHPLERAAGVTTYDLHQHLWPASFQEALRARGEPPSLEGDVLTTVEGRFAIDLAQHDLTRRLNTLDRAGIDVAVLSLQTSIGLEGLASEERGALEQTWATGALELVERAEGRLLALSPSVVRDGFAGVSIGSRALADIDEAVPLLDEAEGSGALVFVHPDAGQQAGPGRPEWWDWVTGYPARMQEAYLAWLSFGRERWPSLRVLFAMLAGGGPFQLERLARRGVDVRSALDANTFFEVSTHGRRAIELCIETFGVTQLAYGSDTPVVDDAPTLAAVRGFGDAVTHVLQTDTPERLLA